MVAYKTASWWRNGLVGLEAWVVELTAAVFGWEEKVRLHPTRLTLTSSHTYTSPTYTHMLKHLHSHPHTPTPHLPTLTCSNTYTHILTHLHLTYLHSHAQTPTLTSSHTYTSPTYTHMLKHLHSHPHTSRPNSRQSSPLFCTTISNFFPFLHKASSPQQQGQMYKFILGEGSRFINVVLLNPQL